MIGLIISMMAVGSILFATITLYNIQIDQTFATNAAPSIAVLLIDISILGTIIWITNKTQSRQLEIQFLKHRISEHAVATTLPEKIRLASLIRQLKGLSRAEQIPLCGANLQDIDWVEIGVRNLSSIDFSSENSFNANLKNIKFTRTHSKGAMFKNCICENLDFKYSYLGESAFDYSVMTWQPNDYHAAGPFDGVNLQKVSFRHTTLENANFLRAEGFNPSNFEGSILKNCWIQNKYKEELRTIATIEGEPNEIT